MEFSESYFIARCYFCLSVSQCFVPCLTLLLLSCCCCMFFFFNICVISVFILLSLYFNPKLFFYFNESLFCPSLRFLFPFSCLFLSLHTFLSFVFHSSIPPCFSLPLWCITVSCTSSILRVPVICYLCWSFCFPSSCIISFITLLFHPYVSIFHTYLMFVSSFVLLHSVSYTRFYHQYLPTSSPRGISVIFHPEVFIFILWSIFLSSFVLFNLTLLLFSRVFLFFSLHLCFL